MSTEAVSTFRGLAEWLVTADPDSPAWRLESRCSGWTNEDVLIHLACTLRELVEPEALPAPVPGAIERTNDVQVEAFREGDSRFHVTEYRRLLPAALDLLESLQSEDLIDETFSLDDAGVYPVHLSAEALAFDHYCHLVHDVTLGAALPPIPVKLVEPALVASTRWLVAGIPQMSGARLADTLVTPVGLRITGPGGGVWQLSASDAQLADCTPAEVLCPTAIETDAADFMLWGTLRAERATCAVALLGDAELAYAVAAAIHVY